jgi:alpha-L-fucosidase 2
MDGNWGGCAGIAEMFLQSHAGFIHILPALPDRFDQGSFRGLRARGGAVVSAEWKGMKLVHSSIIAEINNNFRIKLPGYPVRLSATMNGKKTNVKEDGHFLTIELKKGDKMEIYY